MFKVQPPAPEPQQSPYLPPGPLPYVFEKFQGIKTSTTRPGVPDESMWWCDGFMPIGPRFLRTMYGLAAALWTAPAGATIAFFAFCNISTTPYMLAFLSTGAVWRVVTTTGSAAEIAPAGTIANPSRAFTGMAQWGNQYVVIVSKQTDGYFIWDGTTFYKPGDSGPVTGTMPSGLSGTGVEVYQGRIWIIDGADLHFSAPGSLVNFSSAGGGSAVSSDSFLRVKYTAIKQSNGFLYIIADSSVNYISGVQTSGSPATTTYTNQNADPEVGTPWASAVDTFGRNIIFANAFGVHVSYGAAVTKVSEDLDGVYNSVPSFGGLTPSTAKAIVFGKKVWVLLLPIIDPVSGQQVNKLFIWNNKFWFSTPQDRSLTYIQSQEIDSVLTAWGTDGTSVYEMFAQPSAAFTKVVQSRLWDTPVGYQEMKTATRLWGMAQYYDLDSPDLTVAIDNETGDAASGQVLVGPATGVWTNDNGAVVTWTNDNSAIVTWYTAGSIVVFSPTAVGQNGVVLGLTVSTASPDMALISVMVQPQVADYRG